MKHISMKYDNQESIFRKPYTDKHSNKEKMNTWQDH